MLTATEIEHAPATTRHAFAASRREASLHHGVVASASGLVSPPVALVGGIAFGFAFAHPYRTESSSLARLLLQLSVIALGFGMNLHQVIHAGRSGFLYTAISITAAMTLGLLLGKLFKVANEYLSSIRRDGHLRRLGHRLLISSSPVPAERSQNLHGYRFLLQLLRCCHFQPLAMPAPRLETVRPVGRAHDP